MEDRKDKTKEKKTTGRQKIHKNGEKVQNEKLKNKKKREKERKKKTERKTERKQGQDMSNRCVLFRYKILKDKLLRYKDIKI